MKKTFILIIFIVFIGSNVYAQATAETQAAQIAQKMKDSLSLTDQQKNQIAAASVAFQTQKARIQSEYIARGLQFYLYSLEKDRDSVYAKILPADKYLLYLKKKNSLVNNN